MDHRRSVGVIRFGGHSRTLAQATVLAYCLLAGFAREMLPPFDRAGRRRQRLERFRFGSDVAFAPREELLDGVTVAPLSRSIFHGSPFQAAVFRVAPGGRIARHPASYPQILAVFDGSGNVSGPTGVDEPIEAGEAVFWQAGEEHETKTADGLTALIIEGDGLEMFQRPM
jgi:quercetin dioxygenase-like cupin family protein